MDKNQYEHLPIPTYEEATSSRPTSSHSRLGPQEISDDSERQGLLRNGATSSNYEPPSVESARGSIDSIDGMDHDSGDQVRREMEQMDIEDPNNDGSSSRSLLASRFSKRFSNFTSSFTSLHLPSFPRWRSFSFSWPQLSADSIDSSRVVILGRLFGIFIIVAVVYVLLASDVMSFNKGRVGQMYDPESVRMFLQNHINDHGNIKEYLRHITEFPHIAGTEGNYVLGEWIAELFKSAELEEVTMEQFDVYLNYPRKDGRKVAIVEPKELAWEALLEEDKEETLVFHGHSKSGDVTGPLVYANYGSQQDFKTLADNGISVKGAIVLVRYYGTQGDRALKVKAAELAGAAGCIIYSDPAQDGYVKGLTFPEGRFMPQDGVQRGAVSLMSWIVGDVLSPGWASTPDDKHRLKMEESSALNKIPSIPLSWRDASHLLGALKGHGKKMDDDWQGDTKVEYWTGDNKSPVVNLKNLQDEEVYQPIYNVIGKFTGWEQPNKRVIVGNHRDAWCTGAADPGSGTAIMLEVVRIFGELRRLGWRPLRTIEFASWDGEEYNLIGSTEHVENRIEELRRDGIAYVNVDTAVTGHDFRVAASPILRRVLMNAIGRVVDPETTKSIKEVWDKDNIGLQGLGAGSDYVAFQDIAGMSSMDMSFKGEKFPYHSCADSFAWMERFGDPDWSYHKAMGEIWALIILDLADKPNLQFDLEAYSEAIAEYVNKLWNDLQDAKQGDKIDLEPLRKATEILNEEMQQFTSFDDSWATQVYGHGGFEGQTWSIKRMDHNNRMANFDRDLLDLTEGGGLTNRTQFKHVIFAPQKWSGYDEAYFPGIRDAVDVGDFKEAQAQVQKVADIISEAARRLNNN